MTILKKPLIIAHRGASSEAPENTLAAFKLALEQGCDGIELDVHLSADNQLIVCHDDMIDRTTNGKGYIKEMTTDELKSYDAGSWFDERFKNEKIPLLEEVLEFIPKSILLNIEIRNIPMFYEGIESRVLDSLKKSDQLDRVVISSFDHRCLYRIKKLEKRVKIGLLYDSTFVSDEGYINLFGEKNVHSVHPSLSVIQEDTLENFSSLQLEIFPYTVNEMSEAVELMDAGVSGFITDFPRKMYKLLQI